MTKEVLSAIQDAVGTQVFGIWFLIGAALVFFMQAGFAMVETGFTRAKNAGNIIMKNLMDFCIGTCVFIPLGFGILLGEDALGGFIGTPTLGIFTDYANFDWSNFVFNLVFCATTATIVSGAMAERTKFLSYCIYSAVISAIVYPIEAHWIWGGGWLASLGFHDFAGSCAIHMVGGTTAFIGAAMEGARIGKFTRNKEGKVTKVHAFPGHNIVIGALGCFILWFGWYGFNGAAATTGSQLELDDLQAKLEKDGWTSEYQNGQNQWGTKKSPEAETYIALSKNYAAVIKQLTELVPAAKRKTSRLAALREE